MTTVWRRARRGFVARTALAVAGLMTLAATAARAEISVTLDATGRVTSLNVMTDPMTGRIWGRASTVPFDQVLNHDGDLTGAGFPTGGVIGMPMDDPARTPGVSGRRDGRREVRTDGGGHRGGSGGVAPRVEPIPVVVWSRAEGGDSEIVYSVWDPASHTWRVPAFVDRLDNFVADSAPRVAICDRTIYLSWSRDGGPEPLLYVTGTLIASGNSYDVLWRTPGWVSSNTIVPGPGETLTSVARLLTGSLCSTPPIAADGFALAREGQR